MAGWRGVRRGSVVAVVVALVAVATGCQESYKGLATGPKVVVIGDSISSNVGSPDQAYDNIHIAFEAAHRVSVSGVAGTGLSGLGLTTPTGADSLARAKDYESMAPDAVVIELGTNDVTQATGITPPGNADDVFVPRLQAAKAALQGMLAALKTPTCIVVVTVGTPAGTWYHAAAARWNAVLPDVVAGDSRVRIADWAKMVDAHYALNDPVIAIDLVHLNEHGQDLLAGLMRDTVDGCLQPHR